MPSWAWAGLAAVAGLVSATVTNDGAFMLTQRTDPSMQSLLRNRYIISGVGLAGGLALAAFVNPILGAGVAAGSLVTLAGPQLSSLLGPIVNAHPPASPALQAATQQTAKGLGGIVRGGQQQFGGIVRGGQQQFGGIVRDGQQRFGMLVSPNGSSRAAYYGG